MSHGPLRDAAHRLGRAALAQADPAVPDGDLLARFAADRDEPAFAELVRRHGPAVFGVCRRIVGNAHDAEDAFQAVFVVLARRARSVRPPGSVGAWLYGVAVRTAQKARAMTSRRHRRLAALAARARAAADTPPPDWSDVRAVLDEELAALSDEHRAALVLCDVNGRSRSEAARDLGWPEGTVATRLAKARQVVAGRLRRRGVALSAAGLPGLLAADASAAVTPELAGLTVAAALGPPAAVSPAVQALALGVMKTMTHSAGTMLALTTALAGLLGVGVLAATGGPPDEPAPAGQGRPAAARPGAPGPVAAGWQPVKTIELGGWLAGSLAYSPDGKTLVAGGTGGNVAAFDTGDWARRWGANVGGELAAVAVAPDGKTVAATFTDGVRFLDAATGKPGEAVEEKGSRPRAAAFFPDADRFGPLGGLLRRIIVGTDRGYVVKTWTERPNTDPTDASTITLNVPRPDKHAVPIAVDPRGERVVVTGPVNPATGKNVFWAWSAGSGAGNKLLDGHAATVTAAAWSRDGATIVSGDADGSVIVWDATTFKEKHRKALGGRVAAVAVTVDGQRAAAAVAGEAQVHWQNVYVWPLTDPPATAFPTKLSYHAGGGPFEGTAGLAFSPDGKSLAAGFANFKHLTKLGELVGTVRVWRLTAK